MYPPRDHRDWNDATGDYYPSPKPDEEKKPVARNKYRPAHLRSSIMFDDYKVLEGE